MTGETGPRRGAVGARHHRARGNQRDASLAGLAPNLVSPVVHVTDTGGTIAASLETRSSTDSTPAGVELAGLTAAAGDDPGDPRLRRAGRTAGSSPAEDHAEGDDFPVVRLFATGDDQVEVSIGIAPESGSGGSTIDATLQPDSVIDVPLGVLDAGVYTVRIEAEAPVLAARATVGATDSQTDASAPSDLAWTVATAPLLDSAMIAVPPGPDPRCTWSTQGARPPRSRSPRPEGAPGP